MPTVSAVSRAHGLFNLIAGVWPLLHMRSFVAITGPKTDYWLVRTVALLLIAIGSTQLAPTPSVAKGAAASSKRGGPRHPDVSTSAPQPARRLGLLTAAGLCAIDVIYAARRRISVVYLLDAAFELGWIALWLSTSRRRKPRSRRR
ncbi:hypothetical protein [Ruicaihuangia caeni]|uniref:hypothetical protein n=1 Tax=Ruicaihuangia caeni TaxID=3042517 RepID=UPI00338F8872